MLRFRFPDIFLGAILGVATLGFAIFAMGFVLGSSQYSGQPTQSQAPEKTNTPESKNEQQEPWWQRADAIFTLCLVLVGAFQASLFYVQLKIIRKSLDDAKIAADAARDGAKAAQESADVARASSEAAIAFERPYVRISKIKVSIHGNIFSAINKNVFKNTNILQKPYAVCFIENYGKTPAFVEKTEAQLRFSADVLWCILDVAKPIPVVILKTGQSYCFKVPLGEPINQQRAEAIQFGKQHFWLHFNFVYRDVLGNTHQTPDKWKYVFALGSFSGGAAYREAT